MVYKFQFGHPFLTDAVILDKNIDNLQLLTNLKYQTINDEIVFEYPLNNNQIVYGLGETMRGINKYGHRYVFYNTDNGNHVDCMESLYGAHNFIIFDNQKEGYFFDTPGKIIFDIGKTNKNKAIITSNNNLYLYKITGESTKDIINQFLKIIGPSYIPPLWAFGFGQSRWGYKNQKDIDEVIKGYQDNNLPLDYICMDIDYMDRYIDFTVDENKFPNFKNYVEQIKNKGIRLVPIIDAGVKIEPGNITYEEGIKNDYFCHNEKGEFFKAAVWPGLTHLPDFSQIEVQKWFGNKYQSLTDCGIEGFWNDMNEPAIFYSEYSKKNKAQVQHAFAIGFPNLSRLFKINPPAYLDYEKFYQNVDGKMVKHSLIHNLYGANMTKGASIQLKEILNKRFLLFSRSSYIGSHRYGGIWLGDNHSSWKMLRQNFYQMSNVNMCGYLFSGADLGGFSLNCSESLLIRWLSFGVFTPLMRNHTMIKTRRQECYQYKNIDAFKNVLSLRYRLIPYLYSEYVKAVINHNVLFTPLHVQYPNDEKCQNIEDQLMFGNELMIAPIMHKNQKRRRVYLPEDMDLVSYKNQQFTLNSYLKGEHIIDVDINEVCFFIKSNKCIIIGQEVNNTKDIDLNDVSLLGNGQQYYQYLDDGVSLNINDELILRTK